jgi:hypothetical protein
MVQQRFLARSFPIGLFKAAIHAGQLQHAINTSAARTFSFRYSIVPPTTSLRGSQQNRTCYESAALQIQQTNPHRTIASSTHTGLESPISPHKSNHLLFFRKKDRLPEIKAIIRCQIRSNQNETEFTIQTQSKHVTASDDPASEQLTRMRRGCSGRRSA